MLIPIAKNGTNMTQKIATITPDTHKQFIVNKYIEQIATISLKYQSSDYGKIYKIVGNISVIYI